MSLETLASCIGAYHCDQTGYDTIKKQLVDQTPYGNNLDLKMGIAPVFSTRGGKEVMDLDNTYYFEGENLWKSGNSCVIVATVNLTAADGFLAAVNTESRKSSANNFNGLPDAATDDDWFAVTFGRSLIHFQGNNPSFYNYNGNVTAASAFTPDAMNIFSCGISLQPAQLQAATKNEAISISNCTMGPFAARDGSTMRIGHLKGARGSGGISSGYYLSVKRVYFFCGNIFSDPNFAAARDAEITAWGIV